jgi:hypothetical protein
LILANTEKSGDRASIFHVDSNSSFFPIVGDSVAIAINDQTKDALGRSPSAKFFRVLEGVPPKPKPVTLRITFPNGSQQNPSSGSAAGNANALFIPVDQTGNALPGSPMEGKCPGCVARDGAGYVGPVFHIITPGPVTYEFRIFNNVGEFVAEGKGRIDENDLKALKKSNDASGVNYEAPIVWTGKTRNGGKAGTGAYILKAGFISEKDFTSGAGPGTFSDKKVFGLLRGCCGS